MAFCIRTEKAEETIKLPEAKQHLDEMSTSLLEKVTEVMEEKLVFFEEKVDEWCKRQEAIVNNLLPSTPEQRNAIGNRSEAETQTEFEMRSMCTQTDDDTLSIFTEHSVVAPPSSRRKKGHADSFGDSDSDELAPKKKKKKKKKKHKHDDGEQGAGTGETDLGQARQSSDSDSPPNSPGGSPKQPRSPSSPQHDFIPAGAKSRMNRRSSKGSLDGFDGKMDTLAAADDELDLIGSMSGRRSLQAKMEEVSAKWRLGKYPRLTAFLCRTDGPGSALVQSKCFKTSVNMIVFLNILFIIVQAEHNVAQSKKKLQVSPLFNTIDMCFSISFGADLIMRLIAERASFFFSPDRFWNYMDFGLVMGDAFNEFVSFGLAAMGGSAPSFNADGLRGAARACRAGRMARTLRIFRSATLFALPREVIASFTALPIMIFIWFFIALFFGLIFMQATAEVHLDEGASEESQDRLAYYFGSVGDALLSLFFVLLGAMDWEVVYRAIDDTSGVYSLLFMAFAFFAIVAFYNAITAMCVQSCLARVQRNEKEGQSESSIKLAKTLASFGKRGEVTWGTLASHLDLPLVHGHLERLGLDIADARGICKLMTRGDSTPVNMQEFARACVKFTRTVKGVDFLPVLLANKKLLVELREVAERLPAVSPGSRTPGGRKSSFRG